jgi:transcriptional regulator with XRE-family HTH domain
VDEEAWLCAVGERIRQARRAKGLTQTELGEAVGLATATISDIERGESRTSVYNLRRIAQALDIAVGDLLAN